MGAIYVRLSAGSSELFFLLTPFSIHTDFVHAFGFGPWPSTR
jgi:hypothetical protein